MSSDKQEMRWVLRAQCGDQEAFNELFKLIQQPLYYYILKLAGNAVLAEDILQNVFISIYRKLTWLSEPALFRAWVYRIASREAFKHLQREKRWATSVSDEELLATIPAPEVVIADTEWLAALPELVAQISPASRAVLILHYLQEMSLEEVAEVLGLALGTVKSRLSYGLASLRQLVADKSPK